MEFDVLGVIEGGNSVGGRVVKLKLSDCGTVATENRIRVGCDLANLRKCPFSTINGKYCEANYDGEEGSVPGIGFVERVMVLCGSKGYKFLAEKLKTK